jgi:hypothetical protein
MGLKPNGVKDGAAEKLRTNHQSSRGYILQMEVWILGRRRGDCTVCSLGLAVAESLGKRVMTISIITIDVQKTKQNNATTLLVDIAFYIIHF